MSTSATASGPLETTFSEVAQTSDFPYRALSKGAIFSLLLFVIALLGLVPTFEALIGFAAFGLIAGLMGLRTTRRYPREYSGGLLAQIGVMLNVFLLVGGVTMHTYIYLTEVPEGYERVGFYELKMPEKYADAPTPRAIELDGEKIFLKGYIHPASGSGKLSKFVLVPDLGTCCFGGEPRSSSMIEVTMPRGQSVSAGKLRLKLAGQFEVNKYRVTNTDFDNPVFYRLRADIVN
jgi:hypothetical protein